MTMNRRQFLYTAGAGTALLTMPQFLAGCAKNGASTLPAAHPNPFFAWFGVDEAMLQLLRFLGVKLFLHRSQSLIEGIAG